MSDLFGNHSVGFPTRRLNVDCFDCYLAEPSVSLQWMQIWSTSNKIKLRSFKSSERINEKWDWSYRGFGQFSLFSDHLEQKINYCNFATFNRLVDTKTSIIQTEPNI